MDSLRRGHPGAGACARWHLVFGSARDTTCRHWSRAAGAETVMPVPNQTLIEGERPRCRGVNRSAKTARPLLESDSAFGRRELPAIASTARMTGRSPC
ncbi:nodulation S family protein [Mesorhizobium amorphae]|uniref:nodulation S family protein n=1 Tax=Mesorhizobium amorphae TaxID=71433 RepID=UPI001FED865B|nr:nodulation S family protein [Mesorhizobium amorphae]